MLIASQILNCLIAQGSRKKHVNDDKRRDLCMKKDAAVNVTTPLSSCFCPTWWLSPTTSPWVAPLNSKSIRHLWTPLRWKRKICHLLSSGYATQEDSNLKYPAIGPPWIHWKGQREVCCLCSSFSSGFHRCFAGQISHKQLELTKFKTWNSPKRKYQSFPTFSSASHTFFRRPSNQPN